MMEYNKIISYQKKTLRWLSEEYANVNIAREQLKNICEHIDNKSISLETLYIYLTFNCNQKCKYCWIGDIKHTKDISLELAIKTIKDAKLLGLKRVKLTGGEPFNFNQLEELVLFILDNKISVEIETNGNNEAYSFLKKLENKTDVLFKVSIDSINSKTHDELSGVRGSLQNTINFINNLHNLNIPFSLVTVANKLNFEEIIELNKKMQNLNLKSHRIILNIQPVGHGSEFQNYNLTIRNVVKLINKLEEKSNYKFDFGTAHTTLPPAFKKISTISTENYCNWGLRLCGLMPNGDITICAPAFQSFDIVAGNVNNNSLDDVWNNNEFFISLRNEVELDGVCGNCIFIKMCRGLCRIFAYAKYGKLTSPYPFCQEMYNKNLFPVYALRNLKD